MLHGELRARLPDQRFHTLNQRWADAPFKIICVRYVFAQPFQRILDANIKKIGSHL